MASSSNDKTMGILAYIGILVLIPLFAAKDSAYARFHTNQSLVLWIAYLAIYIVASILMLIMPYAIDLILNIIVYAAGVITVVFAIIGIVNAAKGEKKPLPVIGGIKILK